MTKLILLLFSMTLFACGQKGTSENNSSRNGSEESSSNNRPLFDADSAYAYVEKQVSFGYRVPNTPAHKACGDYLASELKRFGAQVYEQEATLTATMEPHWNHVTSSVPSIPIKTNASCFSPIGTRVLIQTTIPTLPTIRNRWMGLMMVQAV